ncbi:hypothetical protein EX30DRAFT_338252 [Ascodesmis nigricans]|uniref:Uncharacterized protein n=1 Tax=Ascodesmis nigricans TaxID=341454 RepID=A0A4S2N3L8_9PEZI|nr:hypothetical protein EX30DRAFT_338252 [Ascodesmis nigricans]
MSRAPTTSALKIPSTPTTPAPKPALSEFDYHGISIKPLLYPNTLSELAPNEEQSNFYSRTHRHRYQLLRTALRDALRSATKRNHIDKKFAPRVWHYQLQKAAQQFHNELSSRMGWDPAAIPMTRIDRYADDALPRKDNIPHWNTDAPTMDDVAEPSGDDDMYQAFEESIDRQAANSQFPSINNFIRYFPKYSVASAVQDFYQRQDERLAEYHALQELKHRWDICELHYSFHRAVIQLRRSFTPAQRISGEKGVSWCKLLIGDPAQVAMEYVPELCAKETRREKEIGTQVGDKKRRTRQFETLKKIRTYLNGEGIGFPSRICPGNLSVMEFFQPEFTFPAPPWTDDATRNLFKSNLSEEEQAKKWKSPNWQAFVKRETQRFLDYNTIERYYQAHRLIEGGNVQKIPKNQVGGSEEQKARMERDFAMRDPTASEFLQTASSVNMPDELEGEGPGRLSVVQEEPFQNNDTVPRPDVSSANSAPGQSTAERSKAIGKKASWLELTFNSPKGSWPMGLRA